MTTTLVFSRQPLSSRPLQEWLDDTAGTVVLFTGTKTVADSPDELAKYFPRHRLVNDYHSWSAELAAEETARKFSVDRVACTSEQDVLRAARLRARLGLPGQSPESALAYRDKLVMKLAVREAGLPVPQFAALDSASDLLDFISLAGFPIVVKPRAGFGAECVHVLHNRSEARDFLERERKSELPYLPGQWMAESFVEGEFFHMDGIMDNGRIIHGWPSQYNGGCAEHVRDDACLSSQLLAVDDPRRTVLTRLTADVIAALPVAEGALAFHLEAWIRPDGEPVFCEIASRAGGAGVAETYERAFGVHLAKEGLRAQCGSALTLRHQPDQPRTACGWLVLPPGHGTFTPPVEPCPVHGTEFSIRLEKGAVSHGVSRATDSAANALVSGATPEQVRERIKQVIQWWQGAASWS